MANGENQQLRLKLSSKLFISFIELTSDKPETTIAFVSYNVVQDKVKLTILTLKESCMKASFLRDSQWSMKCYDLPDKFLILHSLRAKIMALKLFSYSHPHQESEPDQEEQPDQEEFAVLCQTKEGILFVTERGVTEVFETKGDQSIAETNMICS